MGPTFNLFEPVHLTVQVGGSKRTMELQEGTSEIVKTAAGIVAVKHKASTNDQEFPDSTERDDYESEPEIMARLGWLH